MDQELIFRKMEIFMKVNSDNLIKTVLEWKNSQTEICIEADILTACLQEKAHTIGLTVVILEEIF
jgi:hypothetical protein